MKQISWMFVFALTSAIVFTTCSKDEDEQPDPNPPVEYYSASLSKGGSMYDKFWSSESGFDQNSPYLATFDASSDFFRCKQCHGWDGLGSKGAYIGRAPKTTRPNVSDINIYDLARTKTPKELFDAIKTSKDRRDISYELLAYDPVTNKTEGDKMPNYGQLLSDAQIWDMVKFIKEGMFDVTQLYDATYSGTYPSGSFTPSNVGKDGNETKGNTIFKAKCKFCHGADGKDISLEGNTMGKFARSKANEVHHKVRYGQPGSPMVGQINITLAEMKDLYKALSNSTNFPD